jgi:hypothetical protein
VVDLTELDDNMVMTNKKCILNYHDIDDPWVSTSKLRSR